MTGPKFSIIHASYGRPYKAIAAMQSVFKNAVHPENIEYIFAFNEKDSTRFDFELHPVFDKCKQVVGSFKGSAPAWDAGAKESTGDILIQMQDDVVPPLNWDESLLNTLHSAMAEPPDSGVYFTRIPIFVAISDGYRLDGFCFMAIMNRAYYKMRGEFIHPGYMSVYSDDDVYFQAKKASSEGKAILIEARDIVWKHEHHYHNPDVELDSTYLRENSDVAYAHGQALFAKRCNEY